MPGRLKCISGCVTTTVSPSSSIVNLQCVSSLLTSPPSSPLQLVCVTTSPWSESSQAARHGRGRSGFLPCSCNVYSEVQTSPCPRHHLPILSHTLTQLCSLSSCLGSLGPAMKVCLTFGFLGDTQAEQCLPMIPHATLACRGMSWSHLLASFSSCTGPG